MPHLNTQTPTGGDVPQRSDMKPAFSDNLFDRSMQQDNILNAWQRVRANKGAAGIDGMTIDEFPDWAKSGGWKRVMTELKTGQYTPSPVRRVEIDKPDGGKRQLGVPTVSGRVIQQAIAQVLTPIFGPGFSNNSFGFRPRRNGQQAVKRVQGIIKQGRRFAVDVDLSKFFDRVNHDLRSISRYLENRLKLVVNTSKSHVVKTNECKFLGFTFLGGRIHWRPKT